MPKRLERLDADELRRRKLTNGQLADEIGGLQHQIDRLKAEAIRRELSRAAGLGYRIVLSPPGEQQRTDKAKLLEVLGISAAEYAARFCYPVPTGWRLTCTRLRRSETM
jgi:uncharacterized small protein (DUF1192 family)